MALDSPIGVKRETFHKHFPVFIVLVQRNLLEQSLAQFKIDLSAFLNCSHSENLRTLLIDKDYSQAAWLPKKLLHLTHTCVLVCADLCLHIYKSMRV